MEVHPASRSHLDQIAALLVEQYSAHSPLGATHALANHTTAVEAAATVMERGAGYVALNGATLAGFVIAPFRGVRGPTTARLGMAHHAARSREARDIYRSLYEAVSADLVAAGITYHSLPVLAELTPVVQTFFELEFGIDQIDGMLSVPSAVGGRTGADCVREATDLDIDAVVDLAIELQRFHSRSPMFQTALDFDIASIRRGVEAAVSDDRSAVVVIERDDRLLGMAQAGPASAYFETLDIGMNVIADGSRSEGLGTAMLQYLVGWAASKRYRYCAVGWTSSNLISDRFYRSRGFTPIRLRLHRRIDSHISQREHSD